ncbi:MAG: gliding motility protein GldN [Bacteroidetes bacterium]|nr:gliding motility protein GldN [Bacteroidota bacterium]
MSLLAAVLVMSVSAADAQTKKRTATKRPTSTKGKTTTKAKTQAPPVAAADTAKPQTVLPEPELNLGTIRKSLRPDDAIDRNLVKERTPLAYEHIREDDAVYRQRLWRELDVHEKMNLPFVYKAEGDNGNQRFIIILLNAIKSGEVTAFDPVDDRFTTPYTFKQIAGELVGKPQVVQVQDWSKDPDGSKGYTKDSVIMQEFNPNNIEKYWIKEDVVFDKESSRLHTRILGIAPLKTIRNPDGSFRDVTPVFWVYYPDLRPMLAKYEAYNGKNFGARMSWEEVFESRMFASRIIKSTVENPNDLFIKEYVNDPILRLLEGDNIKEKIFNYEQDLWSY